MIGKRQPQNCVFPYIVYVAHYCRYSNRKQRTELCSYFAPPNPPMRGRKRSSRQNPRFGSANVLAAACPCSSPTEVAGREGCITSIRPNSTLTACTLFVCMRLELLFRFRLSASIVCAVCILRMQTQTLSASASSYLPYFLAEKHSSYNRR